MDSLLSRVGDMALKRRAQTILKELEIRNSDRVLDCGCGDGFYLHLVSQISDCELYGLDVDSNALESAKRNLADRNITLMQGDVTSIPFKDNFFDRIILSEVLEHLPDDMTPLREIRRVLKPEGFVLITVPNRSYPFLWDPVNKTMEFLTGKHIKKGFWSGIWHQHLRLYSLGNLRGLVEKAGFEVVKIQGLTHYCLPFNHFLVNIGARLLYGGWLPSDLAQSVNKFSSSSSGQAEDSLVIRLAYKGLNAVDRLNGKEFQNRSTVSIFLKARKIK